jgi:hypothetical protein
VMMKAAVLTVERRALCAVLCCASNKRLPVFTIRMHKAAFTCSPH